MESILTTGVLCLAAVALHPAPSPDPPVHDTITVAVVEHELADLDATRPLHWEPGDPLILWIGARSGRQQSRVREIASSWGIASVDWVEPPGFLSPPQALQRVRDALGAGPAAALTESQPGRPPQLEAWVSSAEELPPGGDDWLGCTLEAMSASFGHDAVR